jgi:response regulator RpfG family c-di-GMP phosphodiesterase
MNSANKPKVLIVDDRPANLVAMEHILGKLDVELVKAGSGNEALTQTLHQEFALILLDVQMPDIDGYEVAALLRAREATADIPLIFVTAINKENAHVFKGYEAGAVDYLFKPVNPDILRAKVEVFLRLHRQKQELIDRNTELDEFSYVASHDLQEPIRKIISFSQLLRDDVGDNLSEEAEEDMASIIDAAQRMKDLIQDLLRLSRAGRSAMEQERVSLDKCVEDAIDVLEQRIEDTQAIIVRDEDRKSVV